MKTKDIYFYNKNIIKLIPHIAFDIKAYEADRKKFKTHLKLNELITLSLLYSDFIVLANYNHIKTSSCALSHLYYINKFYKVNLYYDQNALSIITFNNGHEFGIKLCETYKNSEIDRMLHYVNKHF